MACNPFRNKESLVCEFNPPLVNGSESPDPFAEFVSLNARMESLIEDCGETMKLVGGANLSTSQVYSGTTSLFVDGTLDSAYFEPSLNHELGDNEFTVEAMVFILSAATNSGYGGCVFDTRTTGNTSGLAFFVSNTGSLSVLSANSWIYSTPSNSVPFNTWVHLAASRFNNILKIFINGKLITSLTSTSNHTSQGLFLGAPSDFYLENSTNYRLNGYIDWVRITKKARYHISFTIPSAIPANNANASVSSMQLYFSGETLSEETGMPSLVTGNSVVVSTAQTHIGPHSIYFPGNHSETIRVTETKNFNLSGDFTFQAWVYPTDTTNGFYKGIIEGRSGVNSTNFVLGLLGAGGQHRLDFFWGARITSANQVLPNQWSHIAVVRVGSTISLYINGIADSVTGTNAAAIIPSGDYLLIGSIHDNAPFKGYLEALSVHSTALWTGNFTPPTTKPSVTSLDITDNTPIALRFDSTFDDAQGKVATVYGGAVISSIDKKFGSSSAYFNGTNSYITFAPNQRFNLTNKPFTISLWIKPEGSGERHLIGYNNTSSSDFWDIRLNATNNIIFRHNSNTASFTTSLTAPNGVWSHLAFVCDGLGITSYINGSYVGGVNSTIVSANGAYTLGIGANIYGGSYWYYYQGYIDDVRIDLFDVMRNQPWVAPTVLEHSSVIRDEAQKSLTSFKKITLDRVEKKHGTSSLKLDGSGFVQAKFTKDLFFDLYEDFTFECWVRCDVQTSTNPCIISPFSWNVGGVCLRYSNSGNSQKFSVHINGASPSDPFLVSKNTFSEGVWRHVAVVRSNDTVYLFVDGVKEAFGLYSGVVNFATTEALVVGGFLVIGASGFFKGNVDQLKITRFAKYQSNFTPAADTYLSNQCSISGTVEDQNEIPAARLLRVYDRSLGILLSEGVSNPLDGSFELELNSENLCTLVALDGEYTKSLDPFFEKTILQFSFNSEISDDLGNTQIALKNSPLLSAAEFKTGTKSLFLNGTNQWIEFPFTHFQSYYGNFTVELWFKLLTAPTGNDWSGSYYIMGSNPLNANPGFELALGSTTIWFNHYDYGVRVLSVPWTYDSNWHHLAITRNNEVFTLWLDGVAKQTEVNYQPCSANTTMQSLGVPEVTGGSFSKYFHGYIDAFRITKACRYTSNFTPSTENFPVGDQRITTGDKNALVFDLLTPN